MLNPAFNRPMVFQSWPQPAHQSMAKVELVRRGRLKLAAGSMRLLMLKHGTQQPFILQQGAHVRQPKAVSNWSWLKAQSIDIVAWRMQTVPASMQQ